MVDGSVRLPPRHPRNEMKPTGSRSSFFSEKRKWMMWAYKVKSLFSCDVRMEVWCKEALQIRATTACLSIGALDLYTRTTTDIVYPDGLTAPGCYTELLYKDIIQGSTPNMDTASLSEASDVASEEMLTPRSKVARMLADIDREIDDAPTPSPPQNNVVRTREADTRAKSPAELDTPLDASYPLHGSMEKPSDPQSDSDSDDLLDAVRRPRGRAARRMLGGQKSSPPKQLSSPTLLDEEDELYSATPVKRREKPSSALYSSPAKGQGNGLFVSPAKSTDRDHESDDGLPSNPFGSKEKLAELVAQKRAERLAREAEEKERQHTTSSDLPDGYLEDSQDRNAEPQIEKIMSDASRPARKASKRALLEMERETQRMARQQALAHQMKVKKKFTTNDLFAKFNFRRPGQADMTPQELPTEGDIIASSAPNSDGVDHRSKHPVSTPPSSPPTPLDRQKALVEIGALSKLVPVREDSLANLTKADEDEELPDMADVLRSSQLAKKPRVALAEGTPANRKGFKLAKLGKKAAIPVDNTSDDELDIVPSLPAHLRAFDRVNGAARSGRPTDSKAIHNLKHLSHIHAMEHAVPKKGSRPSVNSKALESQLRKRAKDQARQQQLERINELRSKGIEVQSEEQREQEAEVFENLLEKARTDAVQLRDAEKAARREAGSEAAAQVSDDEEEDEEYVGSDSEDDKMEEGEDEHEQEKNELVEEAAEESEEDEEAGISDAEEDLLEHDIDASVQEEPTSQEWPSQTNEKPNNNAPRKARKSRVVMDEDDEVPEREIDTAVSNATQSQPNDDPFAAFGFGAADPSNLLLSPTQAFNATMQTPTQATQEDSFDILRRIAPPSISSLPPTLPDLDTQIDEDPNLGFVAGSQVPESQRVDLNWETQPPETPSHAAPDRGASALSETPRWEPTQDRGLPSPWSAAPLNREHTLDSLADHDTQSTVRLRVSESPAPSQTVPKRGRLGRRRVPIPDDSDDELATPASSLRPEKRDAFREMAQRRKEALTAAEKVDVEKEMRQMMDEQAEESEDEYAGLGGDDFVAPETDQDREMIDSSNVDVNERELAAHFAERQRVRDEEETSKLYKDLTTGVLRRKMGANTFDLDEDEDELVARRRQMRQLEEAKKRKALLKDENIATLAEGRQSKGKDAFLKAIADDDDGEDDVVELSEGEEHTSQATQGDSTQPQSQQAPTGPLRETSGNKRRLDEDEVAGERPPAKQRRTQVSAFKRPTSLMEVQESVSFLLDEPHAPAAFGPTALELSSDSEVEEQEQEQPDATDEEDEIEEELARMNDGGFAPNPVSMDAKAMPPPRLPASQRRAVPKPAVVDRLSLQRASSSSTDNALGRTAWAAGPATGGFKAPSLLRRATTNTATSANDRGVTTSTSMSRENSGGMKMGGSKKSSLAYQARAEERKAIVEASTKRREENTARIAQLRRNSSALSKGLTGRFE
ncbi:hypothetical protein LTR37_016766 [Vermiconidia calcicola]|uniref:Uncharacterized protein n=1 Tax=Vermiconidia calcicola TaxID=1690605 RepID=A0ACC3MMA0_9PEZI|nr:hypothetical protein LTR37_016766 [Vermiconidia calcicola]